ncbi:hypothetical protein U1Q18_029921, partial [Sarracenia purpurea var. burkii]
MPPLVILAAFNTGSFHWVNACNSGEKPLPVLALATGHHCFCPDLAKKKITIPENSSGDFPKHQICAESSNKNVPLLLDHLCASVFAGFRLRRFGSSDEIASAIFKINRRLHLQLLKAPFGLHLFQISHLTFFASLTARITTAAATVRLYRCPLSP